MEKIAKEDTSSKPIDIQQVVTDILATIDRNREQEIISRRFGLFDRRETLEQIGELLGITRERVRQLEKAVLSRLKLAAQNDLPHIKVVETTLLEILDKSGKAARISEVTPKLAPNNTKIDQARVAFLANLSPKVAVVDENDDYYLSIGITAIHDENKMKDMVGKIIDAISQIGEPAAIDKISSKIDGGDVNHVAALASISKNIANLHGRWGLIKWPMVNPKNIRDKIYVILHDHKKPMHFSEIAKSIKDSDFRRKNVTTQAIHNELIKDKRFVLIGRGIYALREWGYKKGTVADVIADVLRAEGGQLHRDEIVKRVLKSRQVKETTILLNLQGKPQFKRVAKATYTLAE